METIIEVVLRNRRATFAKPYPAKILQEYFRFHPENYFFMPAYKRLRRDDDGNILRDANNAPIRAWDGYIHLLRRDKIGTGLFLATKDQIESEWEIQFKVEDRRKKLKFQEIDTGQARPYQIDCFKAMKKSLSGGLLVLPTRIGKTFIAGLYLKAVIGSGVFIVDDLHLLEQSRIELSKVIGEPVGKIGEQEFLPERVTVATIQTLNLHKKSKRFEEWISSLKVMFLDELHMQLNKRAFESVNHILPRVVFGMTATLELKKKKVRMNALNICGSMVYEYKLETGTKQGFLTPGVVVSVPIVAEDLEEFKYQDAYRELVIEDEFRNHKIVGLVEEGFKRGKSILVLVQRIKHLKILSQALEHIPHQIVYGKKSVPERIETTKDFDKKKCRLIIANQVFKRGITIKAVDMIVECSALKSKNDAVQKYGRGIGLCKGKTGLLYFDISDRSIEGVTKESPKWNRFHPATVSRLNALKAKKIKVHETQCRKPGEILEDAEIQLQKEISRVQNLGDKS